MTQLDILLPFGLPPEEMAHDLLRQCQVPALSILLARSKTTSTQAAQLLQQDPFSRTLPHEYWLSQRFGLTLISTERGNSPPIATALLDAYNLPQKEGVWFVLHPAHIHVTHNHLVLTDINQLALSDAESRKLFACAQPLFAEANKTVLYGDAHTWFLRADDWSSLQTATPAAACGRNIDIWMPQGSGDRAWRKLQNEVQMQWHADGLNEAREMRGLKAANALWLWGDANATSTPTAAPPYDVAFNLSGWFRAFTPTQKLDADNVNTIISNAKPRNLLLLEALLTPVMNDEWTVWLETLEMLDRVWFTPLLQALRDGKLDTLTLMPSSSSKLTRYTVTRASLRKFWTTPSLSKLTA